MDKIPHEFARNAEQSALNRLLPVAQKVFTPEDLTRRVESLEAIVRVLLDRLGELDGKRIMEQIAPFGYRLTLVEHDGGPHETPA